jgi:DNA-binding response OmpR family regulator
VTFFDKRRAGLQDSAKTLFAHAVMSSIRILIIEDEQDVIDLLTLHLRKAGFTLATATDGATGLRKAREESPALIILDLLLPKMPGLEVCKVLKTDIATRQIPIIMLTAKAEEIDRIVGLEFGADDYVTKPFSPRELVLRVNAILRRGQAGSAEEKKMAIGPITLDPSRHLVAVGGKPVRLTSVEFKLLSMLMQRQGRVQARDRLLNEVWGYESLIDTRTVDTHVRRLRKKLGKAAGAIETVRGFGYRIREG